jgi:UDP-2,3-diacylglucosamine pyrophosphatase LpxH
MKRQKIRYRTVIISDVHLGFTDCKIAQVNHFLRHISCEKLIMNGDIIDGWHLKKWGRWTVEHTRFFRLVLKKAEKHGTEVIYLRGNHDDFLWKVLPLQFDRVLLANEYIHETPRGNYVCVHGDAFDAVTTNFRWLALLGSFSYSMLLMLNRFYNWTRRLRGKEYYSISRAIKAKVKNAVSAVGRYEKALRDFAAERQCIGIICGHIHTPADKMIDGIHYLNSGDWVESLTAIGETYDGRFELIEFEDFQARLAAMNQETKTPVMDPDDDEEPEFADDAEPHLAAAVA